VLQTLVELSCIDLAICPGVLSLSVWFSIKVFSCVDVSGNEVVSALAMFEAHFPLAFIPISVGPGVNTIAMSFGSRPLSFPDTVSLLETLVPLAIIDLSVLPGIHSFPMSFSELELAEVCVAVWVPFESFAVSQITIPKAFVLAAIPIFHDSFAMSFRIDDCP
jgi:hypothetical protein